MNTKTRWIRRWRTAPLLIIVLVFSVGSSFRADSDCGLGSCSDGACEAIVEGCASIAVSGCIQALGGIHCSRGCGKSSSAKADASTPEYTRRSLLAEFAPTAWKGHLYTLTHHTKDVLQPHWQNFQQGRISLAEFRAILHTIRTGAWKEQTSQQSCKKHGFHPDAVCYSYNHQWKQLVPATHQDSIPSVLAEHPITIYLQGHPEHERRWQGRVDSYTTPHLPGFPAISLGFQNHPASDARVFLSKLSFTSALGGRYTHTDRDQPCHPSFASRRLPWLVDYRPQFTEMVSAQGQWPIRRECYQRDIPIPSEQNKEDAWNQNLHLNQANPLTNGHTLLRRFELKHGVLLDHRTLFLFYREFWDLSAFTTPYEGWILLQREDNPRTFPKPTDFVGNVAPSASSCQRNEECATDSHCHNQRCVLQIHHVSSRTSLQRIDHWLTKAQRSNAPTETTSDSSKLQNAFVFPGHQLEHGGIEWVGPEAFRLYRLYQARQAYQMALEPFFMSVITQPTDQVIKAWNPKLGVDLARASVQKAQTLLTIAQQYNTLNMPQMACRLLQHTLVSTHLERLLMYRLFTSPPFSTTMNQEAITLLSDLSVMSKVHTAFQSCSRIE